MMKSFQNNQFLKILMISLIISFILFCLLIAYIFLQNQPQKNSTSEDNSQSGKLACPENGYVDCMPILDEVKQKACSPEAMEWYKTNCPNFQGGAL